MLQANENRIKNNNNKELIDLYIYIINELTNCGIIVNFQKMKIDGAKEALREFKEVMSNQEKLVKKKEIHFLGLEMKIYNLNAEIHGLKDDILQNKQQLKRKKNLKI